MAEWLGDDGRADWARGAPRRAGAPASSGCGTPSAGATSTRWSPASDRPMASQHGQAAAIVGGLAPAERYARLVEVLTDEDDLVHAIVRRSPTAPPTPERRDRRSAAYLRARPPRAVVGRRARRSCGRSRSSATSCTTRSSPAGRADLIADAVPRLGAGRSSAAPRRGPRPGTAAPSATAGRRRRRATSCSACSASSRPSPASRVARIEPELGHLEWARGRGRPPRPG